MGRFLRGMNRRRKTVFALVVLGLSVVLVRVAIPQTVAARLNRVRHQPPYAASQQARELHAALVIVDLHADSLLWGRDLLSRSSSGHVDIPRLVEGNVALQVFTVPTKAPRGQNIQSNNDKSDMLTALAISSGWPRRTWKSLKQRALYQAERLRDFEASSNGRLVIIRSASDLDRFLQQRRQNPKLTGAILGLEGAHALEGDLNNLDVLYDAGFRIAAPTHFFDTDIAGSASGMRKGGLTKKGQEFVRRMEEKRMLIDLAHASAATIDDVTAMAKGPVIVSHTGVRGTCDNQRNLSDKELRAVAKTGGVIGIGYWQTAVCGTDAAAVARAVRYAVNVAGIEHVGLGSDFDGAVTMPFDTTGIVQITDALLKQGFTPAEIQAIMGGNTIRVLRESLPD